VPRKRIGAAFAAASALAAVVVFVAGIASTTVTGSSSLDAGMSCVVLDYSAAMLADARKNLEGAVLGMGALPFGLALLGAFSGLAHSRGPAIWWGAAWAMAPVVSGAWRDGDGAALAPLWAGFWCLVAAGLGEALGGVAVARAAPWWHGARPAAAPATAPTAPRRQPHTVIRLNRLGHDRQSLQTLWQALRVMPQVTIVAEDAGTDLLFGASDVERRTGKALRIVPRDPSDVRGALTRGTVFAFPRAQLELRHRGVQFKAPAMSVPGLAEVQAVHACVPIGRGRTDVSALGNAPGIAPVARGADARGPVTIYLGGGAGHVRGNRQLAAADDPRLSAP
jgi:hypothetical protein